MALFLSVGKRRNLLLVRVGRRTNDLTDFGSLLQETGPLSLGNKKSIVSQPEEICGWTGGEFG